MLAKVKSAVIVTASVIAVLYVAYRIPTVGPLVSKLITPPNA